MMYKSTLVVIIHSSKRRAALYNAPCTARDRIADIPMPVERQLLEIRGKLYYWMGLREVLH